MKLKKLTPRKSKAQALVEFAVALPVLMLLLYGLLEAGRLLFLYSNVVTASREAVRYGSASGAGNGTGNANEPRYQDCDGIRNAAQRVSFLGRFLDSKILLEYDTGPGTPSTPFCAPGLATDNAFQPTNNTYRITVKVEHQFTPIVPLVPFIARPIKATSSRTVLLSISIEVTPPYTPTFTPSATSTPTITSTPTSTATPTNTPLVSDTPSSTPTASRTPLPTITFTPSSTPTIAPTPVPSCNSVTHGPFVKSGKTLHMTITNPYGFPITFKDTTVTWNDDAGHNGGVDKTLILQAAELNGTTFWTGNISDQSTYTIVASPVIPPSSTVTLTFTFDKTYNNFDGTEAIYINLLTPGCEGNPIQ